MPNTPASLQVRAPSAWALVAGVFALTGLAVLGAAVLDYSKKQYVVGYLETRGGDLRVLAPSAGVLSVHAREGQAVRRGEPLATVSAAATLAGGEDYLDLQRRGIAQQKLSLEAERRSIEDSRLRQAAAFASQLAAARSLIAQSRDESSTRREALALDESRLERQRNLVAQGFVSPAALDAQHSELLGRRAELKSAARDIAAGEARIAELTTTQLQTHDESSRRLEELKRELQALSQVEADHRRSNSALLVSPQNSAVAVLAATPGDSVVAGQLLLKLARPDAPLDAVLLLPPEVAGRARPGQAVELQLAAYPSQTYGNVQATVSAVDRAPMLPSEVASLRANAVTDRQALVRATARIDQVPVEMGGATVLRSGMQFEAAIEVERKSFLAWMLWPLIKPFR